MLLRVVQCEIVIAVRRVLLPKLEPLTIAPLLVWCGDKVHVRSSCHVMLAQGDVADALSF